MEEIINEFITLFFLKGFKIFFIIIISFIIIRFGKIIIKKTLNSLLGDNKILKKNKKIEEERIRTIRRVLYSTLNVVILIVAILTILPELNINIGPLLAGAGIAGIAIGMGARNLIQDYFSGLFILIEDQYRVGEEVNIVGVKGKITDFNLRRTIIKGEDNSLHIIPNGQITRVNNFSRK